MDEKFLESWDEAAKMVFGGAAGGMVGTLFANGNNQVIVSALSLFIFFMMVVMNYVLKKREDLVDRISEYLGDDDDIDVADHPLVLDFNSNGRSPQSDSPTRRPGSGAS